MPCAWGGRAVRSAPKNAPHPLYVIVVWVVASRAKAWACVASFFSSKSYEGAGSGTAASRDLPSLLWSRARYSPRPLLFVALMAMAT